MNTEYYGFIDNVVNVIKVAYAEIQYPLAMFAYRSKDGEIDTRLHAFFDIT